MNDTTTPWIDPELIAAGKLLQEKGLVAPDRTVASIPEVRAATDRIGAFRVNAMLATEHNPDRARSPVYQVCGLAFFEYRRAPGQPRTISARRMCRLVIARRRALGRPRPG